MKFLKLAVAAAIAVSGLTVSSAPAAASAATTGSSAATMPATGAATAATPAATATAGGVRLAGNRGRHYGWRNNRHRVCRWIWRHHHRQRVCYYRRYR